MRIVRRSSAGRKEADTVRALVSALSVRGVQLTRRGFTSGERAAGTPSFATLRGVGRAVRFLRAARAIVIPPERLAGPLVLVRCPHCAALHTITRAPGKPEQLATCTRIRAGFTVQFCEARRGT